MKDFNEMLLILLPKSGVITCTEDKFSNRYYRITESGVLQICEIEKIPGSYRIRYEIVPLTAKTYPSCRSVNGQLENYGLSGGTIIDASMVYFNLHDPRWDELEYYLFSRIPTSRGERPAAIKKMETLLEMVCQEFDQCETIDDLYKYSLEFDENERKRRLKNDMYSEGPKLIFSHIGGICGAACVLTHLRKYQAAREWLYFEQYYRRGKNAQEWINAISSSERDSELAKLYTENYACNLKHLETIGITLPMDWQQIVRLP